MFCHISVGIDRVIIKSWFVYQIDCNDVVQGSF